MVIFLTRGNCSSFDENIFNLTDFRISYKIEHYNCGILN